VKLYFDGKIRQWYSRGDGKGVIFLVDAKAVDKARAVMEMLTLARNSWWITSKFPSDPWFRWGHWWAVGRFGNNGEIRAGWDFPMKRLKILVAGATGRTGSAVVAEPVARGVPVRAAINSKTARCPALQRNGVEFPLRQVMQPACTADLGARRRITMDSDNSERNQSSPGTRCSAESKLEAVISEESRRQNGSIMPFLALFGISVAFGLAVWGAMAWHYICQR
jgi:hypothetical protein